jgi:protein TonB
MKEGSMLAYAANAPRIAERRSAPNALLFIVGAHVAVIAAVMSAKMDLPRRFLDPPIVVQTIRVPPPPAPNPVKPSTSTTLAISHPTVPLPLPPVPGPIVVADPQIPVTGSIVIPTVPNPLPLSTFGRHGPELITPASELKPPYPPSKILTEEEAVLRLRLSIDERGRVVAVEPIGRADPVFLEAARRYLVAHWRYRPASDAGSAVASSAVVTLHFQLDG